MNDSLRDDIDTLCDVYMMPSQLAALDRIIAIATLTAATSGGVDDVRAVVVAAVDEIKSWYPTCAFPEDGKSLDCKSASMARLTADNVLKQFDELTAALKDGGG